MTTVMEDTKNTKIKKMFEKGAHYGYSTSTSHPKMKPFIFASRNGIEIFDLEKTSKKLDEAKDFLISLGSEKKEVLFVGTKNETKELIKKIANELEMPYVTERWLGGTLTNFSEIKKRLDHLADLQEKMTKGDFEKNTKLERLRIDRKITKMKRYFGGIEQLKSIPVAMVVVDTECEKIAVAEAKKQGIPVVGLMSSDCNPASANYVIPANDSSIDSIDYFLEELAAAYKEGVKKFVPKEEKKEEGEAK